MIVTIEPSEQLKDMIRELIAEEISNKSWEISHENLVYLRQVLLNHPSNGSYEDTHKESCMRWLDLMIRRSKGRGI
jgi:hypothetical protein